MKTRMERYHNNHRCLERTKRNYKLYDDLLNDETSSFNINVPNNVNEIDITKLKEMVSNREQYRLFKKYKAIMNEQNESEEKDLEYDIYEDIENKIYDINRILEAAKSKREFDEEREKLRKLRNTQYNILTNLELNKQQKELEVEDDEEEMVTDFFTKDKELNNLIKNINKEERKKEVTSLDLFDNLKATSTVLTEPIKEENIKVEQIENEKKEQNENTFYTNVLSFTQNDFENLQDLQKTVTFNNKLIKILIVILLIVLLSIIGYFIVDIYY